MILIVMTPAIAAGGLLTMVVACPVSLWCLAMIAWNRHREFWSMVLFVAAVAGLADYAAIWFADAVVASV